MTTRRAPTGPLGRALDRELEGEVRDDPGALGLYATDASNYRHVPLAVAWPRSTDDLVAAVAIARDHDVPVLTRGGGTGLAGQTCNEALVLDCSRHLTGILEVDPDRRLARVQPGVVLDRLRDAAEAHGLTFGPDPATHDRCTLGGMIGNDSCGVHSVMAGKTVDNVEALDVLLYDGTRLAAGPTSDTEYARILDAGGRRADVYAALRRLRDEHADRVRSRFPAIPRRVSGYNLDQLLPERGFHVARSLVGSEGTCATILEATVRLVESPPARVLVVVGYDDIFSGCDAVEEITTFGPIGLEGMDDGIAGAMRHRGVHADAARLLPEGGGWLLVEFGGATVDEAAAAASRLVRHLERSGATSVAVFEDRVHQRRLWEGREAAVGATSIVPGEPPAWPGWEDSAVPPNRMGTYLRELRALLDTYRYRGSFYGHFGQGCLHTRISFDLATPAGVARMRSFVEEAADLVVSHGGSLSGEHGDGQARSELLTRMFGPELVGAFAAFKQAWDPAGRMNPGRVVDPRPLDADLRAGPSFRPIPVATTFAFTADGGRFADATLRCVGVGKCRREGGGVMCPSYMVTKEEEHSTRGRAHLLYEMLNGGAVDGGWRDPHVKDALDLCLSCKGCKSDCPAGVDMATYKAEFLSHHYRGRLRPRAAYAMGLVPWWVRIGAVAPAAANALSGAPALNRILKAAGGVAPAREIPRLAPRTFRRWWARRPAPSPGGDRSRRRVVLWPDTFTDHFRPGVAQAAVSVLEDAGFEVVVPPERVCCGRPLYDFGMLHLARRVLDRSVRVLAREVRAGTPVVGLEPSCVAAFRDELPELVATDDAHRVRDQTFTLAELLRHHAPGWEAPQIEGRAVVQRHCHHHAVMGFEDDEAILRATGLEVDVLDSGCCGMAGSFGFEAGRHYDVSLAAAERVLLPAVRAATPDTLVVADGFSCAEQIRQGAGRRAVHLAEVLARTGTEG